MHTEWSTEIFLESDESSPYCYTYAKNQNNKLKHTNLCLKKKVQVEFTYLKDFLNFIFFLSISLTKKMRFDKVYNS